MNAITILKIIPGINVPKKSTKKSEILGMAGYL
jgi:hypothetical protein